MIKNERSLAVSFKCEVINEPTTIGSFNEKESCPESETAYNELSENVGETETIEHSSVLKSLIQEMSPIDFHERAGVKPDVKLSPQTYQVLAVDAVLAIAKEKQLALCTNQGMLYVYNKEHWKQTPEEDIKQFLGESAAKLGINVHKAKHYQFRDSLIKQFYSQSYLSKPEKQGNEVLINLKNGTFAITRDARYLRPFDKDDFLTYQLGFSYEPEKKAPLFEKYLNRVVPDKFEQMVLAEYVAYAFVKKSILKLEKALILYGTGANGKSVFFEVVNALMGRENITNYSLQALTDHKSYERAKICNKLLNYAPEISPKMDSTLFKQLVSGEPIEARLPYKEPFIMDEYAKLIFNTNHLPKNVEQNEAFFRRFILVGFDVTIPADERDATLASKIIATELEGVFNWVLEGLTRLLQNRNFTYSEKGEKSLEAYKKESDTVCLFLEDYGYVPDQNKTLPLQNIYNDFKEYCSDNGCRQCSNKTFADRLRYHHFSIERKTKGNVVYTIKKGL